jgi:hypothetical protein
LVYGDTGTDVKGSGCGLSYPGIPPEGLSKTTIKISHDSRCPGQGLNGTLLNTSLQRGRYTSLLSKFQMFKAQNHNYFFATFAFISITALTFITYF